MRRTRPDQAPLTTRRYLISDVSDKGQLRWYVQLRDKLPKIRIHEEFGSDKVNRAVDAAIVDQIGKFGDANHWIRAENNARKREPLPTTPPVQAACVVLDTLQAERPLAGNPRSVKKGWPKARETRGPG
jgi:hypothetical protein